MKSGSSAASTTDPITFQAVLSADGTIQFNYLDLVNGTSVRNNGASATVGIKDAGAQGGNRTLAAFNDGPNDYVGTGLSTVIGIFNNTPPSVLRLDREMVRQYEGNAGDTTVYDYTVTRLSELDNAATVDFQVIGAGLFPADADDFVGGVLPSGTVTFAPGEVTQTISISVAGDDDLEIDERFTVVLSNPTLAVLQNTTAYGLIRNEDRVIVTNVNDSGPGSLRNAIDLTNAVNGSPTIYFEIPGDDFHVISPITPLPAVTNGAILDASLQEGYDGTPRVILSGDQLGPGDHGLVLAGEKALVKGFAFVDFGGFGVVAAGDGGHQLLENEYGLIFGTDPRGNGGGAHLMSPDNTVDDSLLVDMHGPAIVIDGEDSDGNRVRNNLFGLTDTAVMPLHGDAIIVTDADAAEISFNTISGNPGDAIVLGGDDHHVEGNTIGLALDGAAQQPGQRHSDPGRLQLHGAGQHDLLQLRLWRSDPSDRRRGQCAPRQRLVEQHSDGNRHRPGGPQRQRRPGPRFRRERIAEFSGGRLGPVKSGRGNHARDRHDPNHSGHGSGDRVLRHAAFGHRRRRRFGGGAGPDHDHH